MHDKRFFLSFRGYRKGHPVHANFNEISGLLRPILSFFQGAELWLLFPANSQRGHEVKTENLGPFAAKFGLWPGIKLFQIFQH